MEKKHTKEELWIAIWFSLQENRFSWNPDKEKERFEKWYEKTYNSQEVNNAK